MTRSYWGVLRLPGGSSDPFYSPILRRKCWIPAGGPRREWARAQLEGRSRAAQDYHIGRLAERPVNNAQLVGREIYPHRLDLFDRWYQRNGADVGKRGGLAALRS